MKTAALVLAVALLLGAPGTSQAANRSAAGEFGFGVLAVACNILYGPAKVLYALGGTIVAGPAWVFSGQDRTVFRRIVQPAVRGDYVLTPKHLSGEETWHFMGRDPELGPSY